MILILVHSLMKIQKYRTTRNNVKLLENVSQLKKTYSVHAAARKLNNYNNNNIYSLVGCHNIPVLFCLCFVFITLEPGKGVLRGHRPVHRSDG